MLNVSQMEILSICRRNNLEEKNAFVFLASCGFHLRRERTLWILPSTCQCFLGILQVPVMVLLLLLGLPSLGFAKAQGKSVWNWVSGVRELPEFPETIRVQPPVCQWQTLQSCRPDGFYFGCDLLCTGKVENADQQRTPVALPLLLSLWPWAKTHLASQSLGFPKWDEGIGVDNL